MLASACGRNPSSGIVRSVDRIKPRVAKLGPAQSCSARVPLKDAAVVQEVVAMGSVPEKQLWPAAGVLFFTAHPAPRPDGAAAGGTTFSR